MSSSIGQPSVGEDTDIGGSDGGCVDLAIPVSGSPTHKTPCFRRHSRVLSGVLVTMVTSVSWTGFTELVKAADQSRNASGLSGDPEGQPGVNTLRGACGLTYFFTAWLVLAFPPYLIISVVLRHRPVKSVMGECVAVYAAGQPTDHGRTLAHVWKTATLLLTYVLALYAYIQALARLTAADVTSLYATNYSFVYMLSWIVLFEKFVAIRILAMIFSITGIVLFAYVDASGDLIWGVIIAVVSSSLTAIHKVLYSKYVGDANIGQVTLFLTCLGLLSVLILWPVFTAVQVSGAEAIDWNLAPWPMLCACAALLLVFHVLGACAVHVTCKEASGLGVALSVPVCVASDVVYGNVTYPGMKLAAFVLITVGILLILLPEDWTQVVVRPFLKKRRGGRQDSRSGGAASAPHNQTLRNRLTMTTYM